MSYHACVKRQRDLKRLAAGRVGSIFIWLWTEASLVRYKEAKPSARAWLWWSGEALSAGAVVRETRTKHVSPILSTRGGCPDLPEREEGSSGPRLRQPLVLIVCDVPLARILSVVSCLLDFQGFFSGLRFADIA